MFAFLPRVSSTVGRMLFRLPWTTLLTPVNICSPSNNETYQERLLRLEGDKESLVLQVSVLTDQVEAQGEKIRDLESSLEEHRLKLTSTEEMLQQELMSRTSLETQKLDLMDEVSYLKLKLVSMDENTDLRQDVKKLKSRVDELEAEKSQYERKLRATKVRPTPSVKYDLYNWTIHIGCIYTSIIYGYRCVVILHQIHSWCNVKTTILKCEILKYCSVANKTKRVFSYSWVKSVNWGKTISRLWMILEDTEFCCTSCAGRSDKLDECLLSDQSPLSSGVDSGEQSPVSPENRKSHRGIRKLWGKIRRSQSGSPVPAHDSDLGDFKRGGFRATAGPRLARPTNARELRGPFSKWTADQVCDWLEDIGLGQYSNSARIWGPNGHTLLSASSQESERELCIKNPLHRKKLQLAIRSFSGKKEEKSADLDYIWVTRWLDDIGLPQYKDQFNEARVDGHMLQYLTVNDLLFLKVTSQLHHLSIKCAIHVLHVNKFNPNCLKRRPSTESQFTPSEAVQWSNHRVMEWLRSVDLAEYAPNLRGSGVHGGLIMLEPRFNSDTLAMLLNIPPQKTLLRRHLNTNFSSLVGPQAQQEKREYTEAPGYTPLSTTAKVKPKKLGFSNLAHLRRRRQDEATDYVCPVDSSSAQSVSNGTHIRAYMGFRGLSPILDREDHTRDQVGQDGRTTDSSP
uniref:PPFIA binding protein 2 n=1 Tax=Neogobius melanostomus TaxID=47308 RepID=A0A8C6SNN3_9GOBI